MFFPHREKSREVQRDALFDIVYGIRVFRMKGDESRREKALFRQKSSPLLGDEKEVACPRSIVCNRRHNRRLCSLERDLSLLSRCQLHFLFRIPVIGAKRCTPTSIVR